MFSNNFGEVKVENGELKLKINKSNFLKQEMNEFVENFEKIYLDINEKFTLIADLSNISLGWTTYNKYNMLIKLFSNNHSVSEKFLIKVIVINNNDTLIKILNWIFYIYGMNHPIEFKNPKLFYLESDDKYDFKQNDNSNLQQNDKHNLQQTEKSNSN